MAGPNLLQRLLNHPLPPMGMPDYSETRLRGKVNQNRTGASATPVFITRESLFTFAGSTAATYGVWNVIALLFGSKASALLWLGYAVALAICMFICWQATADPRLNTENSVQRLTDYDKKVAYGISFLNSFQIFLAALGIVKATGI
jgi:hypothetical protein